MEIAVVNPQVVLQMYHCKDYPWQSLATSPLAVTADNKEKIIANADFTITSAIARRRLSSKKRRNLWGDGGGSGNSSEHSASSSPTGSMDCLHGHRPPNPPTTTSSSRHSPPSLNSVSLPRCPLADLPTTSTHLPPHTHTHHIVPYHPRATISSHDGSTVPLVPAAYHFAPPLPVVTAADHKALTHPVYSQLQQELNYRYLQDQSGGGPGSVRSGDLSVGGPDFIRSENRGFSVPHSQSSNLHQQALVGVASSGVDQSESRRPHQVKWCSAHVTIAKQILAHQQQSKNAQEMAHSSSLTGTSSKPIATSSAAAPLDPAHQIALLQMYGIPTTAAITGGGYMTMSGVPYPALPHDVQLHNLSFVPNPVPTALFMDAANNIVSLKQMPGIATQQQQAPETSNKGLPMVNGVQILPYHPAPHPQSLPMAAVMPGIAGVSNAVNGSYVGHVPVPVIGNCVLNPCHPAGVMAAPWVR